MAYEILSEELPTDNPVVLMDMIAQSEALGDQVARDMQAKEYDLAKIRQVFDLLKADTIIEYKHEKVAVIEARVMAATAEDMARAAEIEADIKYLKRVSSMIERRCSLGQSFLSHLTAQLKAGIGQ